MIRVLLDTDIVLDFLLDRQPFAAAAKSIWLAGEQVRADLYVAAITPINVFYIARKLKDEGTARLLVSSLLRACRICTFDQTLLLAALASPIRDYEDAAQATAAEFYQPDAVVTRNVQDYSVSPVQVLSPVELVSQLN